MPQAQQPTLRVAYLTFYGYRKELNLGRDSDVSLGTGFSNIQLRAKLESPIILSSIQHTGKLYLENKNINVPVQQSLSVSLSRANKTQERCNKEKKCCLHSRKTAEITREILLNLKRQECPLSHRSLLRCCPGTGQILFCKVPVKSVIHGFAFSLEILGLAHNNSSTPTGRGSQSHKEALDCLTADSWCSSPGLLWKLW